MQRLAKFAQCAVSLDPATLAGVDEWRVAQDDCPVRAVAVRRLIEAGPNTFGRLRFGNGETPIAAVLTEPITGLALEADIDPAFVGLAKAGGRHREPCRHHSDPFPGRDIGWPLVKEVADILDLWTFLEEGFERLSATGQASVIAEAWLPGPEVRFRGFDEQHELDHMDVADLLVDRIGRFRRFKGRARQNSHNPVLRSYQRMLGAFAPLRHRLAGASPTAAQLGRVLSAR